METYVTEYIAETPSGFGKEHVHSFTDGSGWGRRLNGHYVEGLGIPLSVAQKIVEGWTKDNPGIAYRVKVPTADEPM